MSAMASWIGKTWGVSPERIAALMRKNLLA